MAQLTALALAGAIIGAVGTLVGTGGGWAMVPFFILAMGMEPAAAAGTSLAVVLLNAVSGTVAYMWQRRVLYRMALVYAAATIPGALAGPRLHALINRATFAMAFGVFLLVLSALLLRQRTPAPRVEGEAPYVPTRRVLGWGAVASLGVGVFSSVLGVGGGIIHVPVLVLALGVPVHVATATSHFVLAATSLAGVVGHAALGHVRWEIALPMGAGAVLGAQGGAWLSGRLPSDTIRRVLAVLLFVFAWSVMLGGR
ncbi:MAG: sulfite exporter TauE/SafE family protein [Deltaproteobacteria bacterium]|nr:sulfite exporter TauE/SafE family protein [Deltaproteobacteria bacterium]